MNDPAGVTAGLEMLAGFNAVLQIVAAFLMMAGAYIVLLALTLAGIGMIGLFYKAANWIQARSALARALHGGPAPASHRPLKSRHA